MTATTRSGASRLQLRVGLDRLYRGKSALVDALSVVRPETGGVIVTPPTDADRPADRPADHADADHAAHDAADDAADHPADDAADGPAHDAADDPADHWRQDEQRLPHHCPWHPHRQLWRPPG